MRHVDRAAAAKAAKERLEKPGLLSPAERLKALREALELTQKQVADQMGVSGPSVNDWENANGRPQESSPYLIQAWTMWAAEQLALPAAAMVMASEWMTDAEREAVKAVPRGKHLSVPAPGVR